MPVYKSIFYSVAVLLLSYCGDSFALSETSLNSKSDENVAISHPIYLFVNVNGRLQLFNSSLKNLSLVDSEFNWKITNTRIILLGSLIGLRESGIDFYSVIEFFQAFQKSAELSNNRVSIVLGEKDIRYLSKLAKQRGQLTAKQNDLYEWLVGQDFIIEEQGQIFVNGGISSLVKSRPLNDLNRELKVVLKEGMLETSAEKSVQGRESGSTKKWPHNYMGNSYCHPLFEQKNIDEALERWQAERIFSASKRYSNSAVESRFQGKMIFFDNGGNAANLWGARITSGNDFELLKNGKTYSGEVQRMPMRHYSFPYEMNENEIVDFLKTAKITSKTNTKEGRTKPLKLMLEKDGKQIKAIYKFVNHTRRERKAKVPRTGDKYDYEMAAFRLGKLLDLGVIPISVERVIEGRRGVVQLWIDNLTSSISINDGRDIYVGQCDSDAQENFMNTFDYLIMNMDRNQSNVLYSKSDFQIWFIDHTRSFGYGTKTNAMLNDKVIRPTNAFRNTLRKLKRSDLDMLRKWVSKKQIDMVWERRERLLTSDVIRD